MTIAQTKNTLYVKSPTLDWINLSKVTFDRYNWRPVLWTGARDKKYILDQFHEKANYYCQEDAMFARMPTLPSNYKWQSIDAEILDNLSFHQPIVQEMLNRWFIYPEKASFKFRSQYYNKLVEIWLNIFEAYKIDLVICPTVPHRVFDYIAYMVAEYKNVPFLMLEATGGIKDKSGKLMECIFAIDKLNKRTSFISKEFEKQKALLIVSASTQNYIKLVQSSYGAATPEYILEKKRKDNHQPFLQRLKSYIPLHFKIWIKAVLGLFANKNLRTSSKYEFGNYFDKNVSLINYPSTFRTHLYHAKISKRTSQAYDWYRKKSKNLDPSRPYVLFTASRQPERSTCPDAGHFYNQIDILKTLIDALPPHYQLYYKEHPSNFRKPWVMDGQRSKSFYETIQSLGPERVNFLKLDTDPFSAIDNATVVVSATGSACWEAIIRGIPAFIFGSTWYENCHGIFKFVSIGKFREDLKLIEEGFTPKINEIKLYIEFLYKIDEGLNWRRDQNFGAPTNDLEDQNYKNRVNVFAQAYHNGLKRYEKRQTEV